MVLDPIKHVSIILNGFINAPGKACVKRAFVNVGY